MEKKEYIECGEKMRWIPVSERMPDEDGDYLCAFDDGFLCTASFLDGDWGLWADAGEVTHWMPMPEPPETEGKDESDFGM